MVDFSENYFALPIRYPELRGQVAIVTGGSRGIGLGIVSRLAREGMRVVVTGLLADEVYAAVKSLSAVGADVSALPGDLRDRAVINALFDHTLATYGDVHLLVNNAGDLRRALSDQLTEQLIDEEVALNFTSPFFAALRAVAIMREKRAADPNAPRCDSIINISSVGGMRSHYPGLPYAMTKGALDGMTRTLAVDIAEHGIRVNGIGPGWTPVHLPPDSEAFAAHVRAKSPYVPMRKPGRAQDIAAAVAFLASDDAAYITGQTIYVDGGMTTQLHPPEHPI